MSVSAKQQKEEIRVFISHRESVCDECHEELGRKAWITLVRDKGALCLADADLRARRREREAERRAELDETFVDRFAARIREGFPRLVAGREQTIAEHACLKYSGRIGRSALGKKMDEHAVRLAVIAHI